MTDATETTNEKLPWNAEQGLRSDKPEVDPNNDLFGRVPFAKHMAKMIASNPSQDGLVMALYGDWGSGKSTVLEFVKRELDKMQQQARVGGNNLTCMDFNPWWFSGHEDLACAFLQQLQKKCEPTSLTKSQKPKNWFGKFCSTPPKTRLDAALAAGEMALAAAGSSLGLPPGLFTLLGKFVEALRKDVPSAQTIPELKDQIDKLLVEHKTRIVVFVDDVDRLLPDEIRQLFTVIKALANFSMVTYVLALDKDVAVHAVENHMGLPGERFLEKIVQVPLNLPVVDKATLYKGLCTALQAICQPPPGKFCPAHLNIEALLEGNHWKRQIFNGGLDALFRVPRDVVRFCNVLKTTYPAVAGEVNPIDFIAIEALRVFLPKLHACISNNVAYFLGHSIILCSVDFSKYQKKNNENVYETIFQTIYDEDFMQTLEKLIDEPFREQCPGVGNVLSTLFPNVLLKSNKNETYCSKNHIDGYWQRVCYPSLFSNYFRLLPNPDRPSSSEVAEFLLKIVQPDFSEKDMQALAGKNSPTLYDWLECLQEQALHLTIDQAVNLFEWLCRVADMPPWSKHSLRIVQLMVDLSRQAKFHTPNSAGHIDAFFKKRLEEAPGIYIKHAWLNELKYSYGDRNDLTRWNGLDALWWETFEAIVETNPQAILDNPGFLFLLDEWQKRDAEKCKVWCKHFISSDEKFLLFLSKFHMQGSHDDSSAMLPAEPTQGVNVDLLKQFIDSPTCLQRLQTMQKKDLVPPEHQDLVNLCIRRLATTADNSS